MMRHRELAMRLRWEIKEEFSPGQQLPGLKTLARRFGVSHTTVRKAMDVLIEENLIKVVHGKGTYVTGARPYASRAAQLDMALRARAARGLRIPAAEQLAFEFGCSPSTARRAIRHLISQGVIRRDRPGCVPA